jgi:hypothetical protein
LDNQIVEVDGDSYKLSTVDCGELKVPSGKLVCCDPFADMDKTGNPYVSIPKGTYKVKVTLADVSQDHDGSHIREAYATLLIDEESEEVTRKSLRPTATGAPSKEILEPGEFYGFGVDAGTACFVDAASLEEGMPDSSTWYEDLFENENEDCWFDLMDNPDLIRKGIANIELPLSKQNNNLILFHSGWGDGFYPVIGGYNGAGDLVAIHIDFFVVSEPEMEADEGPEEEKRAWWRFW